MGWLIARTPAPSSIRGKAWGWDRALWVLWQDARSLGPLQRQPLSLSPCGWSGPNSPRVGEHPSHCPSSCESDLQFHPHRPLPAVLATCRDDVTEAPLSGILAAHELVALHLLVNASCYRACLSGQRGCCTGVPSLWLSHVAQAHCAVDQDRTATTLRGCCLGHVVRKQ